MNREMSMTKVNGHGSRIMNLFSRFLLITAICVSSIIIVPTLLSLAIVFPIVGVVVLIVPFLNLMGILSLPYYVLAFPVFGLPQIVVGIITGSMLIALGVICCYTLKQYFKCIKKVKNYKFF